MQVIVEEGDTIKRHKRGKHKSRFYPQHLQVLQERIGKDKSYIHPDSGGQSAAYHGTTYSMRGKLDEILEQLEKIGRHQQDSEA
jgi:hypothetical protein